MISQRRTAHLGICAAAVVMASSLGAMVAGTGDGGAPATAKHKSVNTDSSTANPAAHAALSTSVDVSHLTSLPQSK